jgi:uncharacterized protein (DUF952 family)
MIIYHIARKENLQSVLAGSDYAGDTLQTEGFIHCSTAGQVIGVANRYFKGQSGLALLLIETGQVKPEIRYENLEGGSNLFPHIYGPVNRDAIQKIVDLLPGQDGFFTFPAEAA